MDRTTGIERFAAALEEMAVSGLGKSWFADTIRREKLWPDVMEMIAAGAKSGHGSRSAFRAAWVLEAAYFDAPGEFMPHAQQFIAGFTTVRNPSAHRHYTKMLCDMLGKQRIRLSRPQAEAIAEFCFDLLIDPSVKVAVKAWAMEILVMLAPDFEWVAENLEETVERLMGEGSPGIVGRGRKVLRRLRG